MTVIWLKSRRCASLWDRVLTVGWAPQSHYTSSSACWDAFVWHRHTLRRLRRKHCCCFPPGTAEKEVCVSDTLHVQFKCVLKSHTHLWESICTSCSFTLFTAVRLPEAMLLLPDPSELYSTVMTQQYMKHGGSDSQFCFLKNYCNDSLITFEEVEHALLSNNDLHFNI